MAKKFHGDHNIYVVDVCKTLRTIFMNFYSLANIYADAHKRDMFMRFIDCIKPVDNVNIDDRLPYYQKEAWSTKSADFSNCLYGLCSYVLILFDEVTRCPVEDEEDEIEYNKTRETLDYWLDYLKFIHQEGYREFVVKGNGTDGYMLVHLDVLKKGL